MLAAKMGGAVSPVTPIKPDSPKRLAKKAAKKRARKKKP